jgi:hypothetical protein
MHMAVILLLVAIIQVLSSTPVFAYRPFATEDAGVAGQGVFQTEISYDFLKWKNGDSDQTLLFVTPIYGPTENLELSIETPFIIHKSDARQTKGVGDINLVGKYVLFWDNYETKDPLLTFKGVVKLNSGSYERGLGRGDTEFSLSPVFYKIITDKLTAHAQFGYTFVTDRKDHNLRDYILYGVALDYAVIKPLHLVTELTGNQNPDRTLDYQNIWLCGFIYEVNKRLSLDAIYKKGIGKDSPDWGVGLGAAIEF